MFFCLDLGKLKNQSEESSASDHSTLGSEEESHAQRDDMHMDPKFAEWEKHKAKKRKLEL